MWTRRFVEEFLNKKALHATPVVRKKNKLAHSNDANARISVIYNIIKLCAVAFSTACT